MDFDFFFFFVDLAAKLYQRCQAEQETTGVVKMCVYHRKESPCFYLTVKGALFFFRRIVSRMMLYRLSVTRLFCVSGFLAE